MTGARGASGAPPASAASGSTPAIDDPDFALYVGDALDVMRTLPTASVDCALTSPPYWGLRDYGAGVLELGLEATPQEYVARLVEILRELRRVLKPTGTLWLNLGDTYAGQAGGTQGVIGDRASRTFTLEREWSTVAPGLKRKDLAGVPWRVALALQDDGWYLRCDLIWAKPNPVPGSQTDRPTRSHEYVFLFSSSPHYYFDADAIAEPATYGTDLGILRSRKGDYAAQVAGRSELDSRTAGDGMRTARSVWTIPTEAYHGAHFAPWPQALVEKILRAGCPEHGVCLDPFIGSGTTALVARRLGLKCIGIELSETHGELAAERTQQLSALAELEA